MLSPSPQLSLPKIRPYTFFLPSSLLPLHSLTFFPTYACLSLPVHLPFLLFLSPKFAHLVSSPSLTLNLSTLLLTLSLYLSLSSNLSSLSARFLPLPFLSSLITFSPLLFFFTRLYLFLSVFLSIPSSYVASLSSIFFTLSFNKPVIYVLFLQSPPFRFLPFFLSLFSALPSYHPSSFFASCSLRVWVYLSQTSVPSSFI